MLKRTAVACLGLLASTLFAGASIAKQSDSTARTELIAEKTQTIVPQAAASLKPKIEEISNAIRLDPKNAASYYRRANLYEQAGDFQRAKSDFTDAIRIEPMNSQFYLARARLYANHGDKVLAEADEKQARFVDPKVGSSLSPASSGAARSGRGAGRAGGRRSGAAVARRNGAGTGRRNGAAGTGQRNSGPAGPGRWNPNLPRRPSLNRVIREVQ
jgi:Tfp pilus assembly protein PilF